MNWRKTILWIVVVMAVLLLALFAAIYFALEAKATKQNQTEAARQALADKIKNGKSSEGTKVGSDTADNGNLRSPSVASVDVVPEPNRLAWESGGSGEKITA